MATGGFHVEIARSMWVSYHVMRQRLLRTGKTDPEIDDQLAEIANSHANGGPPAGAQQLASTPKGYPAYGWSVFDVPITYHLRPSGAIMIDGIQP